MLPKPSGACGRTAFARVQRICEAAGGGLADLIKMTIYMVDIRKNTEVWRARREFFGSVA